MALKGIPRLESEFGNFGGREKLGMDRRGPKKPAR